MYIVNAAMFFPPLLQQSFAAVSSESPLKVVDIPWAHSLDQPVSLNSDGIISHHMMATYILNNNYFRQSESKAKKNLFLRFELTVFFFYSLNQKSIIAVNSGKNCNQTV